MGKYPYQFKTPEEVFAATEKRMEKRHEEIKKLIIAHLDVMNPVQLEPLYRLERAACLEGVSLFPLARQLMKTGEIENDSEL